MEVSRQVKRSVLSGIENDTFSQATVLLRAGRKAQRPHASAHGNDVIVFLRRVDDIDLAVIELVFEFLKKRRSRRKREQKVPGHQCGSTRISNQMSGEFRWIGIDK